MSYTLQQGGGGHGDPYSDLPRDATTLESERQGFTASRTDAYLESKLVPSDNWAGEPSLAKSQRRAIDAGVPEIAVSAMQGQFLSILARGMNARKVLEVGTLWGYSTYFFAKALPPHGQVDTCELSPKFAKIANQTFQDANLTPMPKIHVGPALDTLKTLTPPVLEGDTEDAKGYDLVFIDADKDRIPEYFAEALRLTRKGGTIIVDNAIKAGRIAEDDNSVIDVSGQRKLYDWVQKDQGNTVLMSGIQTVGSKHWDGFAIATKL